MSKKKSSNNSFWGILACVGMILLVFPMFLAIFHFTIGTGSLSLTEEIGLFPGLEDLESGVCATLVSIFAIVALVLAVLYALLYVLEIAKVTKSSLASIRKLIAMAMLAVFVVILICGIVFISANSGEYAGFGASIGFYFALIGSLATGVFGLLESWKK